MLQKAFASLSAPQTNTIPLHSLQQCLSLTFENPTSEATAMPSNFEGLVSHVGSSIVDVFFVAEKGGISWIEFLRGYVKCCGRTSASALFNALFRVFAIAVVKAGLPEKLQFDYDDADCKMSGFLVPGDTLMLLWLCYIMAQNSKDLVSFGGEGDHHGLPDLRHLVLSAASWSGEVGSDFNPWDFDILGTNLIIQSRHSSANVLEGGKLERDREKTIRSNKIIRTSVRYTLLVQGSSCSMDKEIGTYRDRERERI